MNKKTVAVAAIGLGVFLSACEKDISSNGGRKVPVVFSISTGGYNAANEGIRGAIPNEEEAVTEVVPLGNDLYLYATLRPDPAEEQAQGELRASLFTNQKVRFAAFNKTTGLQEGSTVTYTYNGSKLVPDAGNDPLGVEPDDGTVYRFVAYSYYGSPGTDPVETDIAPEKDLVWGVTEQVITDTEAGRKVEINMSHLFSRMRVKVDASTIATAIKNINITNNVQLKGKATDLDIETGGLSDGAADAALSVVNFAGTATVQTSDYVVFYAIPTKVSIGSITLTIGGLDKTFSLLSTNFNKVWVGGRSYTLEVDVKKLVWAGSNIYWDSGAGKLTFSQSTAINYQGVLIKWGSLVGLSPVLGTAPDDIPVYIPAGGGNWEEKTLSASDFGSYNYIPRVGTQTLLTEATDAESEHFLYDQPFSAYTGDICSYLTGGVWRIPTAAEFRSIIPSLSWANGSSGSNASGTALVNAGCAYTAASILFPATPPGIVASGTYQRASQYYFDYTTSSARPYFPGQCSVFSFLETGPSANISYISRGAAWPVRCVTN
jgi:hypothetical protein